MKRTICSFLLFFLSFFTIAFAWDTPELGDPSITALPPALEKKYGKAFMAEIESQRAIYNDPIVNQYIQDLGYKLASYSPDPNRHYRFFVIKDSSINAFAGPNGNIGINAGLIRYVHNEDELASVMAHEISHVTQKHLARQIANAKKMEIPSIAAILAAIATGNGAIASSVISATAAGNLQLYINHTREQEQEADRIGIETLIKAGYNPNGMATLFARMEKDSGSVEGLDLTFLQTHPAYLSRVADAQYRSKKNAGAKPKHNLTFKLIQARIITAFLKSPNHTCEELKIALKQYKTPVLQYTYALALKANKHYSEAAAEMNALTTSFPSNLIYKLTLAEIYQSSGQFEKGIAALSKTIHLYPDNLPQVMLYGSLLVSAKHYKKAADYLEPHYRKLNANASFFFLYAHALGNSGNTSKAYEMRAKGYIAKGMTKEAITQLELALEQKNSDAYTQTSLQAQIDSLKTELAATKRHH